MYLFDTQLHSVMYKERYRRYEKQQEQARKAKHRR